MLFEYLPRNAQPHAGSFRFSGEKRVEDPPLVFLEYSATGIGDLEHEGGRLILPGGFEFETPSVRHRLDGVDDEVHQHLADLVEVHDQRGQPFGEVGRHRDFRLDQVHLRHIQAVAHHFVKAVGQELRFARPREMKHLLNDAIHFADLLEHVVEHFLLRRVESEFPLEHLGVEVDSREGVPDLMGNAGRQGAEGLEAFRLLEALFEFPGLGGIFFVVDNPFQFARNVENREGVIVIVAPPARMGPLAPNGLRPPQARPDRALQVGLFGLIDHSRVLLAHEVFSVNHFTRAVHAVDTHAAIDQEDAVLNGIEPDFQLALGPFHRVEKHCILDRDPQLMPDGQEQIAAFRPYAESTVVGHVQEADHLFLAHERDADDLIHRVLGHALPQCRKGDLAYGKPANRVLLVVPVHQLRRHGQKLDTIKQGRRETVMGGQLQQPFFL